MIEHTHIMIAMSGQPIRVMHDHTCETALREKAIDLENKKEEGKQREVAKSDQKTEKYLSMQTRKR